MSTIEIETGSCITRYAFWNPATWSIPKLYWDAFSQEQRIHAICRQLEKVIKYADYLGVNVDDIASRLKDIEDGKLDSVITAAVEEWFEENEPTIIAAIGALNDALPIADFDSAHTVKDAIGAVANDLSTTNDNLTDTNNNLDALSNTVDDLSDEMLRYAARSASAFDCLQDAIENVDENDKFVITSRYYATGDSGGALYRVTDSIPAGYYETAQNGSYLEIVNPDNVAQFGAKGDGYTDDTAAIQNAVDNIDYVNFEAGKSYRVSNIWISDDDKTLAGNGCTMQSDNYQSDTIAAPLNIGDSSIRVSNPEFYNVNQTAVIYNASNTPNFYQIIITAKNDDILSFKSYKPFHQSDTVADTSPYYFPTGSAVYTGTTIFSISKQLHYSQSGTISNVIIKDFTFEQSNNFLATGNWAQLGYGVFSYNAENVTFTRNHVIGGSSLFLFFYGYHKEVFVTENAFDGVSHAQAVAAHWDMVDISTTNRTHGFNVVNNIFNECPSCVIYSSVDGGICEGNTIRLSTSNNKLGIYLYGGDVSMYTSYSSYDQPSFYTQNVIVSNNNIKSATQSGAGISLQGSRNCLVCNNTIVGMNNGVTMVAGTNDVISGNVFEYTTSGVNNSSIRLYGKLINLKIKDNVFNAPRVIRLDALLKTVSSGVQSTTYWGWSDSSVFVEGNHIYQSAAFSVIFIGGTTETNHAPSIMMDVPKMIMFNNNEVINTAATAVVVFDVNATLQSFITDKTNLTGSQMQDYYNITTGIQDIQGAFSQGVTSSGNITISM